MPDRRQYLRSIAGSIPLLAGCTTATESRSSPTEEETPTPTPTPAPPEDPYYPDGISGDTALKNHRKGIQQGGGHRTVQEVKNSSGDILTTTVTDSINSVRYQFEWGEFSRNAYYDGSKLFAYVNSSDGRKYETYGCGFLDRFTALFLEEDEVDLVSNATYVYEGISEKFDVPLQKYSSVGTQMLTADDKTILQAYTWLGGSPTAEEISIDRWESELWFDAHKIARYQTLDFAATTPSNSYDATHTLKIPSVGDRSVSEPEWYNNAKAAINGTQCERFE